MLTDSQRKQFERAAGKRVRFRVELKTNWRDGLKERDGKCVNVYRIDPKDPRSLMRNANREVQDRIREREDDLPPILVGVYDADTDTAEIDADIALQREAYHWRMTGELIPEERKLMTGDDFIKKYREGK